MDGRYCRQPYYEGAKRKQKNQPKGERRMNEMYDETKR